MKSAPAFVLAVGLVFTAAGGGADAFSPRSSTNGCHSRKPVSTSSVSLLPNQAADLEACAYDLMKTAKEQQNLDKGQIGPASTRQIAMEEDSGSNPPPVGPLSWCRKNLWPFKAGDPNVMGKMP